MLTVEQHKVVSAILSKDLNSAAAEMAVYAIGGKSAIAILQLRKDMGLADGPLDPESSCDIATVLAGRILAIGEGGNAPEVEAAISKGDVDAALKQTCMLLVGGPLKVLQAVVECMRPNCPEPVKTMGLFCYRLTKVAVAYAEGKDSAHG